MLTRSQMYRRRRADQRRRAWRSFVASNGLEAMTLMVGAVVILVTPFVALALAS